MYDKPNKDMYLLHCIQIQITLSHRLTIVSGGQVVRYNYIKVETRSVNFVAFTNKL